MYVLTSKPVVYTFSDDNRTMEYLQAIRKYMYLLIITKYTTPARNSLLIIILL